jgi:hypothetical protein
MIYEAKNEESKSSCSMPKSTGCFDSVFAIYSQSFVNTQSAIAAERKAEQSERRTENHKNRGRNQKKRKRWQKIPKNFTQKVDLNIMKN